MESILHLIKSSFCQTEQAGPQSNFTVLKHLKYNWKWEHPINICITYFTLDASALYCDTASLVIILWDSLSLSQYTGVSTAHKTVLWPYSTRFSSSDLIFVRFLLCWSKARRLLLCILMVSAPAPNTRDGNGASKIFSMIGSLLGHPTCLYDNPHNILYTKGLLYIHN